MSATNSTANYNLSQFIGTDKPAWLVDYNGDMSKIDTAIKGAVDDAANAQSTATSADGKADANALNISTLDGQINDPATGLSATVGNINTTVTSISNDLGISTPLDTTAQTVHGAINEINGKLPTAPTYGLKTRVVREVFNYPSVTPTVAQMCTALQSKISNIQASMGANDLLRVTSFSAGSELTVESYNTWWGKNDTLPTFYGKGIWPTATHIKNIIVCVSFDTSAQFWEEYNVNADGTIQSPIEIYATAQGIPDPYGDVGEITYEIWSPIG